MAISSNLRGALFMSVSMAGFTVNDTITKMMAADMNMGQVMLMRGFFATIFIGLIAWQRGALAHRAHLREPLLLLRIVAEAAATVLFLVALAHMPLAEVSAVLQALPLAVTMGAALVLGEAVGWRRWLAIGCGFLGVLIIVQPGSQAFSPYSLLVLGCVCCCAVRDLATRRLPPHVPSLLVSTLTASAVALTGLALVVPMGGWSETDTAAWLKAAAAASLLVVGYKFIVVAMRVGDISAVAPFRYTALLWALLFGFLVFGDVPDAAMTLGAAIVVGSGLYTLYRERRAGRRRTAEARLAAMAPDGI